MKLCANRKVATFFSGTAILGLCSTASVNGTLERMYIAKIEDAYDRRISKYSFEVGKCYKLTVGELFTTFYFNCIYDYKCKDYVLFFYSLKDLLRVSKGKFPLNKKRVSFYNFETGYFRVPHYAHKSKTTRKAFENLCWMIRDNLKPWGESQITESELDFSYN